MTTHELAYQLLACADISVHTAMRDENGEVCLVDADIHLDNQGTIAIIGDTAVIADMLDAEIVEEEG